MFFFYIGNNETKNNILQILFNFIITKLHSLCWEKKTKNNDARDGKIRGVISSTDQLLTPRVSLFYVKSTGRIVKNKLLINIKNEI